MASNGNNFTNEKYQLESEDLSILKLAENNDVPSLLAKVQELVKDKEPLLSQKLKQISPVTDGTPTVRVMQWNILAQALCIGKDNFVKCPNAALAWDYRKLRILESILEVDPDILCLQEVDHYPFLSDVLGSIGYKGSFCAKPDSPCLYVKDSNGPDGCAAFYKSSKYEEVQQQSFGLKAGDTLTNQVCITYTLRPKNMPDKEFSIAVTHLKAKNGWEELRHRQGSYMLDYLHKNIPSKALILCGDFNAEPTEKIHKECLESCLGLKSSYSVLSPNDDKEPPYTTWKIRGAKRPGDDDVEVCRTIDYIWYTKDTLKVAAVRDFPTGEDMGPARVPSFSYPSDHFSLTVDFVLGS